MKLFDVIRLGMIFVLAFFIGSCNKGVDSPAGNEQNEHSFSSLTVNDETALAISYEMETSTFLTPLHPDDRDLLTDAEKALSIPKPIGYKVVQMVKSNGLIDADVIVSEFDEMPKFPPNMIGHQVYPESFKANRIEIRDGVKTFYNSNGEVITTDSHSDEDVTFYLKAIENIGEDFILSNENMALLIEGYRNAGFDTRESDQFPDIEILRAEFDDGTSSEVLLDKRLQLIRGQINYDSDNKVTTSSILAYQENANGQKELIGHRFATHYTSPFTGVEMVINKISKIRNFTIQKNL